MSVSEVKSAALWLGKLAAKEITYLGGVRDEVEELQIELEALAAFLIEAVKNPHKDNVLRNVLSQARSVAYDCEDVIEAYILKVARHGYEDYGGCHYGLVLRWAYILRNPISLHEIRSKIERLHRRIFGLQIRMAGYWVPLGIRGESHPGHSSEELRSICTYDQDEFAVVVGLEKDLDTLTKVLVNPAFSKQTVMAIHGMGGIGKSTLARELYNSEGVRANFEAFAWTEVSKKFVAENVIERLIYQLIPENDEQRKKAVEQNIKAGRTYEQLYSLMNDIKCLVVVDDVWTSNDWVKLQPAFPKVRGEIGSRILLTTRSEETLSSLDSSLVYSHQMLGLDGERSWELFEKKAFPLGKCTDDAKRDLGREMLQHCSGVPLAITVLGEALKPKEATDWQVIRNNIVTQIQNGVALNKLYKKLYDVLRVSYDELPSHLKNCFLHLANFPEDFEIPVDKLFRLWVAEGIVFKEDPSEMEEEVAERYLNELVSKNMVQVGSWVKGHKGMVKTCRLHDLMRDICIEISKEEGFIQVINCESPLQLMATLSQRDKRLRRLAVHPSLDVILESSTSASPSIQLSKAPNLRSLLLFPFKDKVCLEEEGKPFVRSICKHFPLLRVFELGSYGFGGKLTSKIGILIHLKYLSLANTRITELPSSIVKLQCLQTLDLRIDCRSTISIPNVLWKMKELRNLYLSCGKTGSQYKTKEGGKLLLGGLQCLQTVEGINLDEVDLEGLSMLLSLRRVGAFCRRNKAALYPFLSLKSMKSFSLWLNVQIMKEEPSILSSCESMYELDLFGGSSEDDSFSIPLCLKLDMFPRSLVRLSLFRLYLDHDPLHILEKLPNLVHLEFSNCDCGPRNTCSARGFPELDYLEFYNTNIGRWVVEEGALPKLKTLKLYHRRRGGVEPPSNLPSSVNVVITEGSIFEISPYVRGAF